jgi:hypothetical protein
MNFREREAFSLFPIHPVSRKTLFRSMGEGRQKKEGLHAQSGQNQIYSPLVRVRTIGKFDDEDRDHFYSLLESDDAG